MSVYPCCLATPSAQLASHAHVSQALRSSVLWRRNELLGNSESLRWLHGPLGATVAP